MLLTPFPTVSPLLSVPALSIVFWLPATLKVWLMNAPARFVTELTPPPATVSPLLSVPALSIVFWLPVTLKVCPSLVRDAVDAGAADDEPVIEGAAVDDGVL
jgi:hypothetical protein